MNLSGDFCSYNFTFGKYYFTFDNLNDTFLYVR